MEHDDGEDPELAAAIEASYRSQTQTGMEMSEEQMIAQAMHLSRLEEENRLRKVKTGGGDDMLIDDGDEAAAAVTANLGGGSGSGGASASAPSLGSAFLPRADCPGGASSSGGGMGSASSSGPAPRPFGPPAIGTRGRLRGEEDDTGSEAAIAGGSSRGSSHEPGSPKVFDMPATPGAGDEVVDPHLAAAIEASYAAQTEDGMMMSEDDMIQQAMRMSQIEEESRQRAALKEQQESELQESILMDQMREQEEKRRRVEEEALRAQEASIAAEDCRRKAEEQEAKRSRVPPEPPAGEPNRVDLQIRSPDGKRLRRAFRGTDLVGQIYDYIDLEGLLDDAQNYRLVSTMPRREYEDREQSLEAAGLQGQCALLIERSEA